MAKIQVAREERDERAEAIRAEREAIADAVLESLKVRLDDNLRRPKPLRVRA